MWLSDTAMLKTQEVFLKLGKGRTFAMLTGVGHSYSRATSDGENNASMLQFLQTRSKRSRTVLAALSNT